VQPITPIYCNGTLGLWYAEVPDVVVRNGERYILNDAGTHYVRLLDLAPNLERMTVMDGLL